MIDHRCYPASQVNSSTPLTIEQSLCFKCFSFLKYSDRSTSASTSTPPVLLHPTLPPSPSIPQSRILQKTKNATPVNGGNNSDLRDSLPLAHFQLQEEQTKAASQPAALPGPKKGVGKRERKKKVKQQQSHTKNAQVKKALGGGIQPR